jgi:hypothetical protein
VEADSSKNEVLEEVGDAGAEVDTLEAVEENESESPHVLAEIETAHMPETIGENLRLMDALREIERGGEELDARQHALLRAVESNIARLEEVGKIPLPQEVLVDEWKDVKSAVEQGKLSDQAVRDKVYALTGARDMYGDTATPKDVWNVWRQFHTAMPEDLKGDTEVHRVMQRAESMFRTKLELYERTVRP